MSITITDYVDVGSRAKHLGCAVPSKVAILPRNFATADAKSDLVHESNAATVRTLLRNAGIGETSLEADGEMFPYARENDCTWIGPIMFFTAGQLTENKDIVAVSLGVIANYITEVFRGFTGKRRVVLDVVFEQTKAKKHVKIHYDGDADNFDQLAKTITELAHNEQRAASSVPRKDE